MKTTAVVMVVVQRAFVAFVILPLVLGGIIATAVRDFFSTHREAASARGEGAKVQSGEHTEDQKPCEEKSHQHPDTCCGFSRTQGKFLTG